MMSASPSQANSPPQSPTSHAPRPCASNRQPVRGLQLPIQPSGTLTSTLVPAANLKPPPATGILLRVAGQTVKLQALAMVNVRYLLHGLFSCAHILPIKVRQRCSWCRRRTGRRPERPQARPLLRPH